MSPLHIERRANVSAKRLVLIPIIAVSAALCVGALMIGLSGIPPNDAYVSVFEASLGTTWGLSATLLRAAPIMLTGLAVALALRMQLWNIGAEGQLLLGAAFAFGVFTTFSFLPGIILLPFAGLAAAAGGALWALIAAIPKAWVDLNEIITTLFLNYIALRLVSFLVYGPWQDPGGIGFAYSRPIPSAGVMGMIWGTDITSGLIFSILLVVTIWWSVSRTTWGFSTSIMGGNPEAGKYLSLNSKRRILSVMALSGAIAGLAGLLQLTAVTSRIQPDIAAGYGYTGILIAFLAGRFLLIIPLVALAFSALIQGGYSLQADGLSSSISVIIQAVLIIFVLLGGTAAAYQLRWTQTSKEAAA